MNVLIACEESQEVCKAFRALGMPVRRSVRVLRRMRRTDDEAIDWR